MGFWEKRRSWLWAAPFLEMFLCPQLWLLPVKTPWATQGSSLTPKMANALPVSKGRDLFKFNPLGWGILQVIKKDAACLPACIPAFSHPLPFFLSAVEQPNSCWSQTPDAAPKALSAGSIVCDSSEGLEWSGWDETLMILGLWSRNVSTAWLCMRHEMNHELHVAGFLCVGCKYGV